MGNGMVFETTKCCWSSQSWKLAFIFLGHAYFFEPKFYSIVNFISEINFVFSGCSILFSGYDMLRRRCIAFRGQSAYGKNHGGCGGLIQNKREGAERE